MSQSNIWCLIYDVATVLNNKLQVIQKYRRREQNQKV